MVSHWPGRYFGGEEVGFDVLKAIKQRLDRLDPDQTQTLWMKFSAIGLYWMTRGLSEIDVTHVLENDLQIRVETRFPTQNFTLSVAGVADQVRVNGTKLRPVDARSAFKEGTFLVENKQTFLAFALPDGRTEGGYPTATSNAVDPSDEPPFLERCVDDRGPKETPTGGAGHDPPHKRNLLRFIQQSIPTPTRIPKDFAFS